MTRHAPWLSLFFLGCLTVSSDDHWILVTTGSHHTCGLTNSSQVQCWGCSDPGDDPNNKYNECASQEETFKWLTSVGSNNFGLLEDGTVHYWGRGSSFSMPSDVVFASIDGYCGIGDTAEIACWSDIEFPAYTFYTDVSSTQQYACGIMDTGELQCMGCEDLDAYSCEHPDGTFTDVSSSEDFTCAISHSGQIVCWGCGIPARDHGQCIPPFGEYASIDTGLFHACALDQHGHAICWGDNHAGQLVAPDDVFVQISAGYYHTCGLREDGKIVCWGCGHRQGRASPGQTGCNPP